MISFRKRPSSNIVVKLLSLAANLTLSIKNWLSYGKSTVHKTNYASAGLCIAIARNIGTYLKSGRRLFLI